jgi:lactoylglutathione lyase
MNGKQGKQAMKIDHVAIWTADLERLKSFYQTYFHTSAGNKYANPLKRFESYFLFFPDGGRLELMAKPDVPLTKNDPEAQFSGFIHLAISVGSAEAVDELTARLRKDGYKILDGPRRTGDGYYESSVLDPDNNRLEITI